MAKDNTGNYRNLAAAVLDGALTEYVSHRLFLSFGTKAWREFEQKTYRQTAQKVKERRGTALNTQERAALRKSLRDYRTAALSRAEQLVADNSQVLFEPNLWLAWLQLSPERVKGNLTTDAQVQTYAHRHRVRAATWGSFLDEIPLSIRSPNPNPPRAKRSRKARGRTPSRPVATA